MENLEFIEEVLEQEQKYSEILPTSDELVYETYEFCDEQCLEDCKSPPSKNFMRQIYIAFLLTRKQVWNNVPNI